MHVFVEYARNGSLYDFLQLPQNELLTFESTVEWAKDIARGKYERHSNSFSNDIEGHCKFH